MDDSFDWDSATSEFVVASSGQRLRFTQGELETDLSTIGHIRMDSLTDAMLTQLETSGPQEPWSVISGAGLGDRYPMAIGVFYVDNHEPSRLRGLWSDEKPPIGIYFTDEAGFVISMTTGLGSYRATRDELVELLVPVLQRTRCRLLDLTRGTDGPDRDWWEYNLELDTEGLTVRDVYDICYQVGIAIQFPNPEWMSANATMGLLRAGGLNHLIGKRESHWLEVKSSPYDFVRDKADRVEFAQDVARFANAEDGGVLLIGAKEKKEVITHISPFPANPSRLQAYRDTLSEYIYPPIDDLDLVSITTSPGEEVIAIHVPPQQEHLKPFLVTGAVAEDKFEGKFISIVRRRGDHSINMSVQELHSYIVAGRALLRAGRLPRTPS